MKSELDEHPSPENLRLIVDGVRAYSRDLTGNEPPRTIAYFQRDDKGRIVGGVQGDLWGRSMHIAGLWVDEHYRGRRLGTELMNAIENYAINHGHALVYLETTSFQALPFYQGLGYRVFGELPDISSGHTLYFLAKELNRSTK